MNKQFGEIKIPLFNDKLLQKNIKEAKIVLPESVLKVRDCLERISHVAMFEELFYDVDRQLVRVCVNLYRSKRSYEVTLNLLETMYDDTDHFIFSLIKNMSTQIFLEHLTIVDSWEGK